MIAIHYMLNSVDIIYLHKLYKQWYSIVYTNNGGIYSGTPPPLYQCQVTHPVYINFQVTNSLYINCQVTPPLFTN